MLNTTRAAIEFREVWEAFMVRKTIATAWDIGFVPGGGVLGTWFPPLQGIVSALLYVELTTLLDRACRSQMTKAESKKCYNLKGRIVFLAGQGKVVDENKLQDMRGRRNAIAHDVEQSVALGELNEAVLTVRTQAAEWELIGAPWPEYQPFTQQRRLPDSEQPPDVAMAFQHSVGIKKDGRSVYLVTWQSHTPYLTRRPEGGTGG